MKEKNELKRKTRSNDIDEKITFAELFDYLCSKADNNVK
jgi:hypothetical protein